MHPVTFTPYASASRGPCMPGKAGSSDGCVLTNRSAEPVQELATDEFHEAGGHDEVGQERGAGLGEGAIPGGAVRIVADAVDEHGDAGPLRPGQAFDAWPVGAHRRHAARHRRRARTRR